MSIVRTSSKGQVVVPAEIREAVGLEPGDLVRVTHAGGRSVLIEALGDDPVAAARGLLGGDGSLTRALAEEKRDDDARDAKKGARLLGDPGAAER